MIKYIVVTLSLSFSIYALAQDQNNLVPNSSFESIEGKVQKIKANWCCKAVEFPNCT